VPTRTGTFRDISGALAVERGILSVESLKFNADDLCLWAGGKANLKSGVMDMKVAGRIPRVSESFLSGAFGGASRNITLQRFVTVATFGRLQRLPTLPVLGDIGSDRPRTFQFRWQHHLINQSCFRNRLKNPFTGCLDIRVLRLIPLSMRNKTG